MKTILDIATILAVGLMVGVEFSVSAFINPILRQLGGSAEAGATKMFARRLGMAMPFWYVGAFVLLLAECACQWHQAGFVWEAAASAVWALVIVLTLLFLVPINNRIVQMETESFSEPNRKAHNRWEAMHRARIVALCAAKVLMLIGTGVGGTR